MEPKGDSGMFKISTLLAKKRANSVQKAEFKQR